MFTATATNIDTITLLADNNSTPFITSNGSATVAAGGSGTLNFIVTDLNYGLTITTTCSVITPSGDVFPPVLSLPATAISIQNSVTIPVSFTTQAGTTPDTYTVSCFASDGFANTNPAATTTITVTSDTTPTIIGGALSFSITDPDFGQTLTTICSVTTRPAGALPANDPVLAQPPTYPAPANAQAVSMPFTMGAATESGVYTASCATSDGISTSAAATDQLTVFGLTIAMQQSSVLVHSGSGIFSFTIEETPIGQILTPTSWTTTSGSPTTTVTATISASTTALYSLPTTMQVMMSVPQVTLIAVVFV